MSVSGGFISLDPPCMPDRDHPLDKPLHAALVWFRRDLRATDHAALYHALKAARKVWCVFLLDRDLLDPLPRADRRVEFIVDSLHALDAELRALSPDARLIVRHAHAVPGIARIADELHVQAVYASHDDDPAALARDQLARGALADKGIALHTVKDHVVFERQEVLTQAGRAYSVFTNAPTCTSWAPAPRRCSTTSCRASTATTPRATSPR